MVSARKCFDEQHCRKSATRRATWVSCSISKLGLVQYCLKASTSTQKTVTRSVPFLSFRLLREEMAATSALYLTILCATEATEATGVGDRLALFPPFFHPSFPLFVGRCPCLPPYSSMRSGGGGRLHSLKGPPAGPTAS